MCGYFHVARVPNSHAYVCSKLGDKWSVTLLIACIRHELRMASEGNMRQTYVVKRCMRMRVYAYTRQAKMHVTKRTSVHSSRAWEPQGAQL
eukprot:1039484-Amphidinium_carterae.1